MNIAFKVQPFVPNMADRRGCARILPDMLEQQARYERMARKWFAERGRGYLGDPGAAAVALARSIASPSEER